MHCDCYCIDAAPADRVKLSVQRSQTHRSARTFHWRQCPPGIAAWIVFESDVQGAHMDISCETADDVDLSVHPDRACVTDAARHRRALTPAIRCRIVLLNELLIVASSGRSAHHVNLSVHRSGRYLAAWFRKPRLLRPLPLARRLGSREAAAGEANDDQDEHENEKCLHILVPNSTVEFFNDDRNNGIHRSDQGPLRHTWRDFRDFSIDRRVAWGGPLDPPSAPYAQTRVK